MSDSALVLRPTYLASFDESSFFGSLNAIENFFETIEGSVVNLRDDQLVDLFSLVNQLGTRAWATRALVLEEIENRTKRLLNKTTLTKEEFNQHVARSIDLARSTAYEDIHILKSVRASGLHPRLDRTFYKIALGDENFKEAVEYAEDQYDSLGGKYTTREFAEWVDQRRGPHERIEKVPPLEFIPDEINILYTALRFYVRNNPDPTEKAAEKLLKRLTDRRKLIENTQ